MVKPRGGGGGGAPTGPFHYTSLGDDMTLAGDSNPPTYQAAIKTTTAGLRRFHLNVAGCEVLPPVV